MSDFGRIRPRSGLLMKPLQLVIPSHLRYLAFVRESFYSYGNHAKVKYEHIYDVVLALDEALSNIIEHNYKQNPDKTIKITCKISLKKMVITIEDKGGVYSFNPPSAEGIDQNIANRSRRGFGQFLINRFMNRVRLSRSKSRGNKLVLEKTL